MAANSGRKNGMCVGSANDGDAPPRKYAALNARSGRTLPAISTVRSSGAIRAPAA
jgi:hypothetical protein